METHKNLNIFETVSDMLDRTTQGKSKGKQGQHRSSQVSPEFKPSLHVYTKNSRIANFPELAMELSNIEWDFISFSETRKPSKDIEFMDGYRPFLHLEDNLGDRVGIMIHKRH